MIAISDPDDVIRLVVAAVLAGKYRLANTFAAPDTVHMTPATADVNRGRDDPDPRPMVITSAVASVSAAEIVSA
jgi:hypothetical protein